MGGAAEHPDAHPLGRRVGAALFDTLFLGLVFAVLVSLTGGLPTDRPPLEAILSGPRFWLLLFTSYSYYIIFEATWDGQTFGKRIFGVRVVADGNDLGWRQATVRNVLRIIDSLPAFWLIGIAAMLLHPQGKRVGDMVARTRVVRA